VNLIWKESLYLLYENLLLLHPSVFLGKISY